MANRLQRQSNGRRNFFADRSQLARDDKAGQNPAAAPKGPLSVYTTGVWKRESMFMRWMEMTLVSLVQMWSTPSKGDPLTTDLFVKEGSPPKSPE